MGVRDIAAAAVDAKAAADALAKKQNQKRHGDAGVAFVQEHLQLAGKHTRAHTFAPKDDTWGHGTVVRIEDDGGPLYILVNVVAQYRSDSWGTGRSQYGTTVSFELVNAKGQNKHVHPTAEYRIARNNEWVWLPAETTSYKFDDLVGLSEALKKLDTFTAATDADGVKYWLGGLLNNSEIRFVQK